MHKRLREICDFMKDAKGKCTKTRILKMENGDIGISKIH